MTPPVLVLIGLRGSGKSTLGPPLADALGVPFFDLDDHTSKALGHDTPGDALRTAGEPAFRAAERAALRDLLPTLDRAVLALGGGTPTAAGVADFLMAHRNSGRLAIVYLHAPPATLRDRLTRDTHTDRPPLTGASSADEVSAIYQVRDPLYRQLADAVVETGHEKPADIVERLARRFTPV